MLKFSPNLGSVSVDTGWVKLANVLEAKFVGDSIVAVGCDSNLTFTNLVTAEETLYRAVDPESGDGISCFTGHQNLPLFAFAEATTKSRILVLTHSDNKVISILAKPNRVVRYIHLTFSETEHLIALTGMPNYCLEVWHWRSKELLISMTTDILTDKQTIACSPTSPLTVCQYALYKGDMNIWEVQGSANFCNLIQKKISLPSNHGKFDHTFSIDGVLYLINRFGNVYQIAPSTSSANLVVKWSGGGGQQYPCSVEYLRSGLVVSGPNGDLVYFKKIKNQWTQVWSVTSDKQLCTLKCLISKEFIIGITQNCELMQISADGDNLKMATVRQFDVRYKSFVLLAPSKELLLAINEMEQIEVFDVKTGSRISRASVQGAAVLLECHPKRPYVAVGCKEGVINIVSLVVPNAPKVVAVIHLSDSAIEKICFSASGALMSILDTNSNVFLARSWPDKQTFEIIHHSSEPTPPICLVLTETADDEKLFMLIASPRYGKLAGNDLIGYKIDESSQFKLKLPTFYSSLATSRSPEKVVFGVPFKGRSIHVLKLTTVRIDILQVIETANVVRHLKINVDSKNLLVWGTDGILNLYDLETKELIMTQTLHSRQSLGVKRAECSSCFRYIVTLGYSGNLVCTKVAYESYDPAYYEQQVRPLSDLDRPPTIVPATGQKYIDIVDEKMKLDEELAHKDEKQAIKSDLTDIKQQLVQLIDKNEQATTDEMLSIQSFNLDLDGVAATLERGRLERDEAKNCMLEFIENQKMVNQYILDMCWDKMDVKGMSLRGIFTNLKVENYAIPQLDSEKDVKSCVEFLRNMEDMVGKNDAFLPWKPIPINKLESVLSHEPEINEDGKVLRSQTLPGSSSQKFIKPMAYRYDQLEVISFTQMHVENIMGYHDMMRLRQMFNKSFQKMAESKEYEMNLVCRGNQRLRHIQSELNILSELRQSEIRLTDAISDPQYMADEKPENIVKVEPYEVTISPYVSPSHQRLLDEQFAEMERKRLALLANDFKERALIYMMDGVLEHKWEDEIKKNPPKPECLASEKKPEDYTAEDLMDIQRFEEQVRAVEAERERYREMLETEKIRLTTMSHEQIKKFNHKIGELLLFRLQIEAAICQEEMKLLRFAAYNYQRIAYERKERAIRREMEMVQQQTNDLHAQLSDIQNKVLELRANYENLNTRDKLLDKQFKANYADQCGSVIVDQAYKIFKKRPKFQIRAWATCPILLEMGKRIASKNLKQSEILMPSECQELFQLLDQLDSYALSPSSIDSNQWQVLCKMRRFKIESEYKLRAYGLELAEAEATANAFIREIGNRKTSLINLEKKFHDVKSNKLKDSTNRTVQIVMKKGLIKIPLTGKISDFEDCVLIHRSDIDDINKIIKKTGLRKLKAMQKGAVFRRKIIFREWEHKMLQMSVRDMKEFVNTVEKCKITKEVQLWLKYKEKGWEHDLGQAALNREIENAITNQEKQLNEVQEMAQEIDRKIVTEARKVMALDKEIQAVNVDVAERNMARNQALEEKQTAEARQRMSMILARAKMVRKVQQQHSQILELSTMLELQKLRTFPTLTTQPNLASMKNAI